MSDVQALVARCQELGATLAPSADGKLKVKAPAPLPEELRQELKQRKAEVLALLAQSFLFPCPSCSGPVQLEPPDEYAPTRFWTCTCCGTWGPTQEGATAPTVWVSTEVMH